jgi:CO/xanthine dehydrogenase Mo-binding subunit
VVQGLGFALVEEMVWDGPKLSNPSMMDYKIPSSLDVPAKINALIVEQPDPGGPFGAKGVGEPGLIGVAPTVANGIKAATGVRLRELPMTGERFLKAAVETPRGDRETARLPSISDGFHGESEKERDKEGDLISVG